MKAVKNLTQLVLVKVSWADRSYIVSMSAFSSILYTKNSHYNMPLWEVLSWTLNSSLRNSCFFAAVRAWDSWLSS